MKLTFSQLRIKKRILLFLALGIVALTGCDEYSEAIIYKVRQDPLLKKGVIPKKEVESPDPPGTLPLMNMEQVTNEENPYSKVKPEIREKILIDTSSVNSKVKSHLEKALKEMFGTPSKPLVNVPGMSDDTVYLLELDSDVLQRGSQLFRLQCMQCHGVTGNGRGYSAPWVNPHPRDFRLGLFKFQSVDQTKIQRRKPSRPDLHRTLYYGVEGTSMPAFNLLKEKELNDLVSYVIHLSIRGETEASVFWAMEKNPETNQLEISQVMREIAASEGVADPVRGCVQKFAKDIAKKWRESQEDPIPVVDYPYKKKDDETEEEFLNRMTASVQRGKALFTNDPDLLKEYLPKDQYDEAFYGSLENMSSYDEAMKKVAGAANCVSCHIDYGRKAKWKFDEWGTMVKPRNLTVGLYRGGRRPLDIYYRIHSGINGSGMNVFGGTLKGEQIWDLVNFVQALPYEQMRKKYGIEID